MRFSPETKKSIYDLLVNNSYNLCIFILGIIIRVCQPSQRFRMRITPIPIIPMMLMIKSMNENSVFEPPGAIFKGISGMAEMFDSWDSYPVLFTDTGDSVDILSRGALPVSF